MAISLVGFVGAGCSGDDDDAADATTVAVAIAGPVAERTSPPTQPPTTPAPTTATPTTPPAPPTTAVDLEALKAQIKADYERSWQVLAQLTESPTLDNFDATLAQIAVPGSENYNALKEFVTGMVQRGEHVVRGTPDYFSITVEVVELSDGPASAEAVVV